MTDSTTPADDAARLRECPFCGDCSARPRKDDSEPRMTAMWFVTCHGPGCGGEVGGFLTEKEAIAAWNTRTAPAAMAEGEGNTGAEWAHFCNGIPQPGLRLWVDRCPHCGMVRPDAPTSPAETERSKAEIIEHFFDSRALPPDHPDRAPAETGAEETPRKCPPHFGMGDMPCGHGCGDVCIIGYPNEVNRRLIASERARREAEEERSRYAAELGAAKGEVAEWKPRALKAEQSIRQARNDARDDALSAVAEVRWKERQGDEYGSY